jgi:hypothetical protein
MSPETDALAERAKALIEESKQLRESVARSIQKLRAQRETSEQMRLTYSPNPKGNL